MTDGSLTTVYRHLLRSTSHAVRHDKAACKNIRRVLRDDFVGALKAGTSEEELVQQAEKTMLLHLAATQAKNDRSTSNLLAHQTIRNVSSLCYHHLSPHTRMQPLSRRSGGTDTSALRKRRGSIGLRSKILDGASLAMKTFESSSKSSSTNTDLPSFDLQVLPSLAVAAKPLRGPNNPHFRRFLPGRWDGQKTVKTIQTTSAFIAHLEATVESMTNDIERAEERFGKYSPHVVDLRTKIKKVKGEVKGALKIRQKADDRRAMQTGPAQVLHSIVAKAQANTGAWLGADRFKKWANGGWLPP